MADQSIELKLILRDEFSKAMEEAFAKYRRQLESFNTSKGQREFQGLERAASAARRELSTLKQLTVGGVIGGGVVASLYAASRALGDFARTGLQLHYTASALGVTTERFEQLRNAGVALGLSQEQAAQGIGSTIEKLRELNRIGPQSEVFKELARGARGTGVVLAKEVVAAMQGPDGVIGGLKHLFARMRGMSPEAQTSIMKMFGLPSVAYRDLELVLGKLHQRIRLDKGQLLEYQLAQTNLGISMDNIKTTIGTALLPSMTRLMQSLDKWLQSQTGKEFVAQISAWGNELTAAIDAWIKLGGLERLSADFKKATDEIGAAFQTADKVIKSIGLDWTKVIIGLMALPFIRWLGTVAFALRGIAPLLPVLRALTPLVGTISALYYILTHREEIEKFRQRMREDREETLKEHPPGEPPSGIDLLPGPKNLPWWRRLLGPEFYNDPEATPQKFGDFRDMLRGGPNDIRFHPDPNFLAGREQYLSPGAIEDRRTREDLTDEFKDLKDELAKLNDYLMPAGEGGGAGGGGFGGGGGGGGGLEGGGGGLGSGGTPPSGPSGGPSDGDQTAPTSPAGAPTQVGPQGMRRFNLQQIRQAVEGSTPSSSAPTAGGGRFDVAGGQTWFLGKPWRYTDPKGNVWTDWGAMRNREGPFASGLPPDTPGFASATRRGLGGWYELSLPDGRKYVTRKVDVGPPGVVDLSAGAAYEIYGSQRATEAANRRRITGRYLGANLPPGVRPGIQDRERPRQHTSDGERPRVEIGDLEIAGRESARAKINRSLAHDVAQQVMSGNASIDIDVGAGAKNGNGKKNLFRPSKTKKTPQMPHAGGDTTEWSQYNYE